MSEKMENNEKRAELSHKQSQNLSKGFINVFGDLLGRHNRNITRQAKRPSRLDSVGSIVGNGTYGFLQPSKRLPSWIKPSSPKTVIGARKEGGMRISSLVNKPKTSQRGMGRASRQALSVRSNPKMTGGITDPKVLKLRALERRIQAILQSPALRGGLKMKGMTIEDDPIVVSLINQLENDVRVPLREINDAIHSFGGSAEL
jgi:hypothetical protein